MSISLDQIMKKLETVEQYLTEILEDIESIQIQSEYDCNTINKLSTNFCILNRLLNIDQSVYDMKYKPL